MVRKTIFIICLVVFSLMAGFYWKQHHKQNELAIAPRTTGPWIRDLNNGDTMTGERVFDAVYTDTDLDVFANTRTTSQIDGKDAGMGLTAMGGGEKFMHFSLHTEYYANGPHILRIVDSKGRTDTRNVVFQNTVFNIKYDKYFDPKGHPHKFRTHPVIGKAGLIEKKFYTAKVPKFDTLSASLLSKQPWTVTVYVWESGIDTPTITASKFVVLRTFRGYSDKINVEWDGKDAKGREVPAGNYDLVLHVANCKDLEYNINKF